MAQSARPPGRDTAQILQLNPEAAARLPDPDEEYRRADVPHEVRAVFDKLVSNDIIRRVRRADGYSNGYIWRTDPGAYAIAQDLDDRETLPCGHGGIKNLRGGGYTCGQESCGEEFDRETVEGVFGCEK